MAKLCFKHTLSLGYSFESLSFVSEVPQERKPTQLPTLISEARVAIFLSMTFLAILIAAPHLNFFHIGIGKELNLKE